MPASLPKVQCGPLSFTPTENVTSVPNDPECTTHAAHKTRGPLIRDTSGRGCFLHAPRSTGGSKGRAVKTHGVAKVLHA